MKRNDLLYKWWDMLGNVPDNRFYLGAWVQMTGHDYPRLTLNDETCDEHMCGTTACAGGWLPTVFPDEWELDRGRPHLVVGTTRQSTYSDAATFFGISHRTARQIMEPYAYTTKNTTSLSTVRERILSIID